MSSMARNQDPTFTSYHISLSAIALWPPANYTSPSRRTWLIPLSLILHLLATSAVTARLWARFTRKAGGFGADDALIIGAWMAAGVFTALTVFGVSNAGFDKHIWDQTSGRKAALGGLIAILSESSFLVSTCLTKISILLFYRRLLNRSYGRLLLWSLRVAIGFTIAYLLTLTIFLATFCTPISASWRSLDLSYAVPYKCVDRRIIEPLSGALSAASDIYAIILPEIVVAKLQLPKHRKLVLYLLFGSGALVVIAAVVRTGYLTWLHFDPRRDLTWTAYDLFTWSTIEMQLAIVYACAPALKSLFVPTRTTLKPEFDARIKILDVSDVADRHHASARYDRPSKDKFSIFKPLPPTPTVLKRARNKLFGRRPSAPVRKMSSRSITVTETIDIDSSGAEDVVIARAGAPITRIEFSNLKW